VLFPSCEAEEVQQRAHLHVGGGHSWHPIVADDERAAHAAAVARQVDRILSLQDTQMTYLRPCAALQVNFRLQTFVVI
jgi:hypothetical protein